MKPFLKVGVVAGGYLAAFLIASAALAIRLANTNGPDAEASSGMYAFGDSALFVAVFGTVALAPAAAALFFLRPYRPFWVVLSALALVVATSGVASAVVFVLGRNVAGPSLLGTWAALSVLRILVAPLLAVVFLVATMLAPYRSPRVAFLAAAIMEAGVSAYGGFVWFLPLLFQKP